ncbi:hypothetical protein PsorP6_008855 [Peronosclerospora sorghi]|uniref:Uncharacterized protein n=1 Tax=Peronosclerospora sorghi TaxID=230839 RepID=A0ACC0W2F1_9STRA|nr:hypothetical protein PsorP6_008855 [Peronosclerospora sorghi]
MLRVVLQVKPFSTSMGINTIVAILATISGIRSVHLIPDDFSLPEIASSTEKGTAGSTSARSSLRFVIMRADNSLDLKSFLTPLENLHLADIDVIEQASTTWARKEVVLRVPDMMCPGNCGSSVLNAVRVVDGVEAVRLCFENRQIVVRGCMSVGALCTAIKEIGFDSEINAETPLPRRFRFRVDDLCDVGVNGVKLKDALTAVEGVENLVLLTDRAEVLVVAMLVDSSALVEAAGRVGFNMLELSEEAWGIPVEVVPPLHKSVDQKEADEAVYYEAHTCDLHVCPQIGCPRYLTTVAHTAALAVGWAVAGCGMASGGECTCGDNCKCDGCPEHNPAS